MLVGLTATLAVAAGHFARLDRRIERWAMDLRCTALTADEADAEVLRVTIDDRSPRRADLARLVDVLRECGAETIVLDLPLSQPQDPRYSAPIAQPDDPDFDRLLARRSPEMIFDDARLADALRRHGNVLLPIQADLTQPIRLPLEEAVESALRRCPILTAREVADTIEGHDTIDPDLLVRARKRAIEERVGRVLAADADKGRQADTNKGLEAVREIVLHHPNREATRPESEMARRAYLRARGLLALHPFKAEGLGEAFPVAAARIEPPLVTLGRAAVGEGLVAATEDDDGTVRGIPLLGRTEGRILPHLALAAACRRMAMGTGSEVQIDGQKTYLTLRAADGRRRAIPVDAEGRMPIRWTSQHRHGAAAISAAELAAAWPRPTRAVTNRTLARRLSLRAAELLDTTVAEDLDERIRQAQLARLPDARQLRRAAALLYDPAHVPAMPETQPALAAIEDEIEKLCSRVGELLADDSRPLRQLRQQAQPSRDVRPDAGAEELRAVQQARRQIEELKAIRGKLGRLRPREPQTQPSVVDRRADLHKRIEGRLCWVMSTSSAAAHVDTPAGKRMPLAEVNARAAETILAGPFLRPSSQQDNLVVIVLGGVVASLLASMLRPRGAVLATLVLAGGYAAFNTLVVLRVWHVWIVVVAPLAAMLLCMVCAGLFRHRVEGGARRQVREAFVETMGAEPLERLIAASHRVRLDGQKRLLTCLRCDLDSAEGLWSQLSPSRAAALLQRYLLPLRRILQDNWDAHVRRIDGEGLLAVFGWPLEHADHATRAVRAAVECRLEADRIGESVGHELGRARPVRCHIGVATGELVVTDFGDGSHIDCAVLGPAVHRAKRLASANRDFGTGILACGETWRHVEQAQLLARPLGRVQLTAHAAATRTWEIHPADDDARAEAYDDFARAVNLFARRKFQAAAELFEQAAAALGDDAATQLYLARCRACLASPPDDSWDPAIRLAWGSGTKI